MGTENPLPKNEDELMHVACIAWGLVHDKQSKRYYMSLSHRYLFTVGNSPLCRTVGNGGHMVGGTPRVENTVFLQSAPSFPGLLLRQYPTISEADSRHGLEAKSTQGRHPNAGQGKGEGSRAGDEPSSCLPSSAPVPLLNEGGRAEATWTETQRAGTAPVSHGHMPKQ